MWYPFFDTLVKANVVNTQTFRVRATNGQCPVRIGYLLVQRILRKKEKANIKLQINDSEIPSSRKFPRCHQVLLQPQIMSSVMLFSKGVFTLG